GQQQGPRLAGLEPHGLLGVVEQIYERSAVNHDRPRTATPARASARGARCARGARHPRPPRSDRAARAAGAPSRPPARPSRASRRDRARSWLALPGIELRPWSLTGPGVAEEGVSSRGFWSSQAWSMSKTA